MGKRIAERSRIGLKATNLGTQCSNPSDRIFYMYLEKKKGI